MTYKEFDSYLNKINKRFALECWSHLNELENQDKKIEFLKLLYKLNLLFQKFSERFDEIKIFYLDNVVPNFLNNYYGDIKHRTHNNKVHIATCNLFPNAIKIASEIDGSVHEETPHELFTFFCTSNDPLILFWMKQVKEENKVSNVVISYMIKFTYESEENVRTQKEIISELRKRFRPNSDEAKGIETLKVSFKNLNKEGSSYHKAKRREIEEAIKYLADASSIAFGKMFLKNIP
jgi:RNase H-fold protein (predicted Holliday junction resolvase)